MSVAIAEPRSPLRPEFLPLWHPTAPRAVVTASSAENVFGGWTAWQDHLTSRPAPEPPPFLACTRPVLLCGWPEEVRGDQVRTTLSRAAAVAQHVLDEPAFAATGLVETLQLVSVAYALPHLAADLPSEDWWRLADRLHAIASEAQQHHVDWAGEPIDIVRQQLLAGELPLALGYLFPEVRPLRALRKPARKALSEGLLELTDGQGLPQARMLSVLGALFGCWTRCRWLGERLPRGAWSQKAEFQYQWLVRHALRLTDPSGRFVLDAQESTSPAWTVPMFTAALELAGDRGDYAAAQQVLAPYRLPKRLAAKRRDLPEPSLNSDWSGIAVMADGWSPDDVRLAVAYANDPLRIELTVDGDTLFAGEWQIETTCDGEPVGVTGEWERLCWESGKRCDFLELGIDLSHGLKLERQLLFARKDRVLYLADIVVSKDGAARAIKHSISLPLGAAVAWEPEIETRDGVMFATKARAAVLPLALREWRSDPRGGNLAADNQRLVLAQEARGRALCCPLLLDLNRKRSERERTWRQLTVGESLEVVPSDVAVAYRAQFGADQWLFYRSLGPVGNRTFLGQNIAGELSAGRFCATGKYNEWIEVECT